MLKGLYGKVLGSSGLVTIGNNCFIGYNSTVLKGVTIGDNVIIGANSVVTKDIPSNSVAVGNPARVIMNIEDYYKKRKEAQYNEAKELVLRYREVYGKNPSKKELSEFFWLFSNGKDDILDFYDHMNHLVGYNELTINKFLNNEKMFNDFKEFLDSIK